MKFLETDVEIKKEELQKAYEKIQKCGISYRDQMKMKYVELFSLFNFKCQNLPPIIKMSAEQLFTFS